jgi:predicted DNA-binding protein YlxM (UPF0122 family)
MESSFINVTTLAKKFDLSRPSIYNLIKKGDLKMYQLAGKSYINIQEFETLFKEAPPRKIKVNEPN